MNKRQQQSDKSKGFTIIEVVLVLAIAGLIFLMVFIALPALQKGQRDAQRKQDLQRISVQMTSYLTNTKSGAPSDEDRLGSFVRGFLDGSDSTTAGNDYKDPNGNNYVVRYEVAPTAEGQIGYFPRSECDVDAENGVKPSDAARDYAFTIVLENQNAPYCINN
jgi:prepilin-type N-terminal cleavage/methylation domain-containing protein